MSHAELFAAWERRLTAEEKAALASCTERSGDAHITSKQAMEYALGHAFERKSVISEKRLMAEALRYGVGSVDVEGIQAQMVRPEIIKRDVSTNQRMVTTQEVVNEEKRMIAFARAGQGTCEALGTGAYRWKKHCCN